MLFSTSTTPPPFEIHEDGSAQSPEQFDTAGLTLNQTAPGDTLSTLVQSNNDGDLLRLASKLNKLSLDSSSKMHRCRTAIFVMGTVSGTTPPFHGDGSNADEAHWLRFIHQTSEKPSFRWRCGLSSIEGVYHPNADGIQFHNAGHRALEFTLIPGGRGFKSGPQAIDPEGYADLHCGFWKLSVPDQPDQPEIGVCIFPRRGPPNWNERGRKRRNFYHELDLVRASKRLRRSARNGGTVPSRALDFSAASPKIGAVTTAVEPSSGLATEFTFRKGVWPIASTSPAHRSTTDDIFALSGTGPVRIHSRPHDLVAVRILDPTPRMRTKSSTLPCKPQLNLMHFARQWERETTFSRKTDTGHPFITRILGSDAHYWLFYMDGQPTLLSERDRDDYFTGSYDSGVHLLFDIASALTYLHANFRKPHFGVSSSNIFRNRHNRYTLAGFQIEPPQDLIAQWARPGRGVSDDADGLSYTDVIESFREVNEALRKKYDELLGSKKALMVEKLRIENRLLRGKEPLVREKLREKLRKQKDLIKLLKGQDLVKLLMQKNLIQLLMQKYLIDMDLSLIEGKIRPVELLRRALTNVPEKRPSSGEVLALAAEAFPEHAAERLTYPL
ncbi:hypothetical protein BHE90_006941 [Fusarium euwallaceae]|uniref:Protein kinase domain-containing protein n=1 Tax=Fusarium euwallaceae TaxID=1147111 RepID=A0A430LS69_9HYPO|nr:hypothetical protein BHE90_006941 [Fusarium euwallaceae]